jgi:hypothetical protein
MNVPVTALAWALAEAKQPRSLAAGASKKSFILAVCADNF